MFLFRPFRDFYKEIVLPSLDHITGLPTCANRWRAMCDEFHRWRQEEVESVASGYFTGPGIDKKQHEVLPYNSKNWCACLIFCRMRNFDLILRKHTSVAYKVPDMALGVPIVEEHADHQASDTSDAEDRRSRGASVASDTDGDGDKHAPETDSAEEGERATKTTSEAFPRSKVHSCGIVTCVATAADILSLPSEKRSALSAEARYAFEFQQHASAHLPEHLLVGPSAANNVQPVLAESFSLDTRISGVEALRCAAAQKKFFAGVDQNRIDPEAVMNSFDVVAPSASSERSRWEKNLLLYSIK